MLPQEVQTALSNIEKLEMQLIGLKDLVDKRDELKAKLYDFMEENGVYKYTTPNELVTFTMVSPSRDRTEIVVDFDVDKLREDDFETYQKYVVAKEKVIKGRKGYLKTTYTNIEKESDN
jgi:hypothetical protein